MIRASSSEGRRLYIYEFMRFFSTVLVHKSETVNIRLFLSTVMALGSHSVNTLFAGV